MGKRKTVGEENLAFLKTYFSKKLVDGTLKSLLTPTADIHAAEQDLRIGLQLEDAGKLNQWFDDYLSVTGRNTVWAAFRTVGYRRKNPRSEQELRKAVVAEVMAWAKAQGINDLNEAVLQLLEAQKR